MIKKLQLKITGIIVIALIVPLLAIIIGANISNYKNVIHSNSLLIEKVFGSNNPKNKTEEDSPKNNIIEGMYSVTIKDSEVKSTAGDVDESITKMAEEIYEKDSESGIYGNYIYKKRKKAPSNGVEIVLIENKESINGLKKAIGFSIGLSIGMVAIIILLAKSIARVITKPVAEMFQKQTEFISDASHELKTPLAVMQANADVLEEEIGKNKWLQYIQNETENMSKLIAEMLLLTKIENVESIREKEEFNLSEYIELVASSFEGLAYEKKVTIKTELENNIITHNFSRDDIEHILSTLTDNAIKHSYKNKDVVITLKKNKESIILSVRNEGKEIPEEDREKIFERFYRVDKSRNRNEKRYGLGLAIAKSTATKYGGTISLECKEGTTTFYVKLPIENHK